MPKAVATGTMMGTTTTIAEKASMKQPTSSSDRLSTARNTQRDSMLALVHSTSRSGTCASTR